MLERHLEEATSFRGTSPDIQNDLLDCMLSVAHDAIKAEIQAADFVSVISDDTTDTAGYQQNSVVFRYLLSDSKTVERF